MKINEFSSSSEGANVTAYIKPLCSLSSQLVGLWIPTNLTGITRHFFCQPGDPDLTYGQINVLRLLWSEHQNMFVVQENCPLSQLLHLGVTENTLPWKKNMGSLLCAILYSTHLEQHHNFQCIRICFQLMQHQIYLRNCWNGVQWEPGIADC